ncbi:MAG TPA: BON domain-containing protein [Bryobacteraceae bacterium]|jgi:osmotically-inducible protein OsmY|nr:BON domain-containing protein [Bryobacteraceae bacterium]
MKIKTLISLLVIFALALGAWAAEKQVSDDQIHDMVMRKLADDTVVKGGALDIEVKDGVVTLKGKVELEQQKTKAEKLARKVSGVKQVDNQIVVVGKGNPR